MNNKKQYTIKVNEQFIMSLKNCLFELQNLTYSQRTWDEAETNIRQLNRKCHFNFKKGDQYRRKWLSAQWLADNLSGRDMQPIEACLNWKQKHTSSHY